MEHASTAGVNGEMDEAREHDIAMIAAYLEHERQVGHSADTIDLHRSVLTQLNRTLPYGLGAAEDQELLGWICHEKRPLSTRSTYMATVKTFYRWAVRKRWLTEDPTEDLDGIKVPRGIARPCTDAALAEILARAPGRVRVWATLASYQGLRCCEISGLDREHVTQQQLVVVRGKGGDPRAHDTDPAVWAAVKDLPPGPVARLVRSGRRAGADYIGIIASSAFTRLGYPEVTMHMLRHWLGVNVQRAYRDIRVTQAMLGHKSLNSTMIYTAASLSQQQQARATLPRLAG